MCSHKTDTMHHDFSLEASALPPGGRLSSTVPQFVSFSFDDNGYSGLSESGASGGMRFVFDTFNTRKNPAGCNQATTFDNSPVTVTFYLKGDNLNGGSGENGSLVRLAWKEAFQRGNEIGLHTFSHPHGSIIDWTLAQPTRKDLLASSDWASEINRCRSAILDARIGIDSSCITGFRVPYLEYNEALFDALDECGIEYDASVEEGWQSECDGATLLWPYTLHAGSPGDIQLDRERFGRSAGYTGIHPGILEMPVYTLTAPPDELCSQYRTSPGLRSRMKKEQEYFNLDTGKCTGVDWNLWFEFFLSATDAFACLAYSFDLRYSGNRCPFLLGVHSDIYSDLYDRNDLEGEDSNRIRTHASGRRQVLADFLDYVLSKADSRVVSMEQCRQWLMNPVQLKQGSLRK